MHVNRSRDLLAAALGLGVLVLALAAGMFGGIASNETRTAEAANAVGNDVGINYTDPDTGAGFVVVDLNDAAAHAGTLNRFRVRRDAGASGDIRFLIFSPTLQVTWVSPQFNIPAGPDDNIINFDIPGGAPIQAGGFIGFYAPNVGSIPFNNAGQVRISPVGIPVPPLGFDMSLPANNHPAGGGNPFPRTYAIRAIYGCGLTCYVDENTGDDTNNHGTSPADAFATIQKGVDEVQDGGTVIVAAGDYPEDVLIEDPVTLKGPNFGKAGADPTRGPEADINAGGSITVDGDNIIVDGFKVTNGNNGGSAAILVQTSSSSTVRNTLVDAPVLIGIRIASTSEDIDLHRNAIVNVPATAIYGILTTFTINVEIADNVIDGYAGEFSPISSQSDDGVSILRNLVTDNQCGISCLGAIHGQDVTGALIAENDVEGSTDPVATGNGIAFFGTGSDLTIRNNYARVHPSSVNGTALWIDGYTNVTVTLNHLHNTSIVNIGLFVDDAGPLNAEKNWWGSNTGPSGAGPGSGSSVVDVDGLVDFDPWLCSGTDLNPSKIGFQPASLLPNSHHSPCDMTKPVWTATFKKTNGAAYAFGTWSQQYVKLTFTCTDPAPLSTGIAKRGGLLSVTFTDGFYGPHVGDLPIPWNEGTHKGDAPFEECVDKAGNVADPIEPFGGNHVQVDITKPVCSAPNFYTYVPKNATTGPHAIPLTANDATSGINVAATTFVVTPGFGVTYVGPVTVSGIQPNLTVNVPSVTMPNAAGRNLAITATVRDIAGNSNTCVFNVRSQ